jgi:hypothetical protein
MRLTRYSGRPDVCPGQSPTRRIMVRIEEEYFGAFTISVSMVPRTMSLPKRKVRIVLTPLHCIAKAKPFGSERVSLN